MGDRIEPAGLRIAVRVECGYIGFDIQEWRAVKDVHIFNLKRVSCNTHEPDNREPDCIRPFRCPCCKYAVGVEIKKRFYFKGIPVAPVECIDKNHMGKFLQVLETGNKFRTDFNGAPLGWMGIPAISGNGE